MQSKSYLILIMRLFFMLIGMGFGYKLTSHFMPKNFHGLEYVAMVLSGLLAFLLSGRLIPPFIKWLQTVVKKLIRLPLMDLLSGTLGLMIGLTVAFFLDSAVGRIPIPVIGDYIPAMITIILGYLGFQVGYRKREELVSILFNGRKKEVVKEATSIDQLYKILDTSVIIDGRILDVGRTGFLDGTIVVPQFVLKELQDIADSADANKRLRGRRGLDTLAKMQKESNVKVIITEMDFNEIAEVDSKLVKLAKEMNGKLVTNDFNLNKICKIHHVPVLNLHDLTTAIKLPYLVGDELEVNVIKGGKEERQGLAYLDDGTMIIIESGKDFIGKKIDIVITSITQSSAGRMFFAKPKETPKAKSRR